MKQLKWSRPNWQLGLALFAILFGLMTLKEGGAVLFINGVERQAAGQYVPFVLWFNFIAGFAYIVAGAGLWANKSWSVWLAMWIAGANLLVFAAFCVYVFTGGAYEIRTMIAMPARTLIWMLIAGIAWVQLIRRAP